MHDIKVLHAPVSHGDAPLPLLSREAENYGFKVDPKLPSTGRDTLPQKYHEKGVLQNW